MRRNPKDAGRPAGLIALSVFFGLGALLAGVTALALAFPGSLLEAIWRLRPEARSDLARMGGWAIPLMAVVSAACGGAAAGLYFERPWGRRLAIGVLGMNLLGDTLNAVARGDARTLIGLPVGGAMIGYLFSRRIRDRFEA